MSFLTNIFKYGLVRGKTDASGATVLVGADGNIPVPGLSDPSLPILCIGGDHPYAQWFGDANNGMGKMYSDRGLKPYMSINSGPSEGNAPGAVGMSTWEQVKSVNGLGCELIGHGHRHINFWGRLDTGIRIQYLGANATATVHVTGSPKTLTLTAGAGEGASLDLTNASYDTLAELAASINAVNGGASWLCDVASELLGTELSTNISALVAARSVKIAGAAEYFAAGSGIVVSYTGTAYSSAIASRTANNLEIYLDGVRALNLNTTLAAQDTLGEMVTQINSAGISGLTAALIDNGGGSYKHYTRGDELSSELSKFLTVDLTQFGGLYLDGGLPANGAIMSTGLPHSYLLNRQWKANKDTCADNGVNIVNWAQSGGQFYQHQLTGQNVFRSYRTNQNELFLWPAAHWAAIGPDYIRSHYEASFATLAQQKATIDAMVDSPGCMVDLLAHALTPATPAGKNGYTIQASSSPHVIAEDEWLELLDYVKAKVDAGLIAQLTPEEARRVRKWSPKPQNLCFNPNLRHDGTGITSIDSAYVVPGWVTRTNQAHVTAASIATTDDCNKITVTTNAITNTDILAQYLKLEPGKTYRIGCRLEIPTISAGAGVGLVMTSMFGSQDGLIDSSSVAQIGMSTNGDLSMLFSVPSHKAVKPRIRGNVAGPFNIVLTTADTLTIKAQNIGNVVVTLTAGAARTATQIADEINAAFAATPAYSAKQQYWKIATVEDGRVVLTDPNLGFDYYKQIIVTGNAAATVFGQSQCISQPVYGGSGKPSMPFKFIVRGAMTGTFTVSKPYCVEVNNAY